MAVLEQLEPNKVFAFFEEICGIPHGSDHVKEISDYLVKFAKDRNLWVKQDEALNVIIKKNASAGYEDRDTVILQGHMDMVAVHDAEHDVDMTKEPLKLQTDGKEIWAEGTSLGGDDGIAVAYCLALLDDDSIPHPALEVVITTNEETGMDGARALDTSVLTGRQMINIDNEEEGVLLTGCAGGGRFHIDMDLSATRIEGTKYEIRISGLLGGHSGEMIREGRGNANHLIGRFLEELRQEIYFCITELKGGTADNVIPSEAVAEIVIPTYASDDFENRLKEKAEQYLEQLKMELAGKDSGVTLDLKKKETDTFACADSASVKRITKLISVLPDGVQAMSGLVDGLVETSLNLGTMRLEGTTLHLVLSVRSSIESAKKHLVRRLELIADAFNAEHKLVGEYPGWAFRENSPLRDHMVEVYRKLYGEEPRVEAIHAGVECGFFESKIEGLDCVSIGPDMKDIHSPKERLSVASTKNVWEYLLAVLA